MINLNKINFNRIDPNHKLRSMAMKSFSWLPDKTYLKFVYRMRTGKKLNLENPVGFCDKLNWLKLYDRHPEYTQFVDKIAVRDIVKERIGDGYSFPLLGYWKRFEDIDFNKLPNEFVLKCNHDSGSYRIIKDKSALTEKDIKELKKHFNHAVSSNPFFAGREYPYKKVDAYIFAERYMKIDDIKRINDYKFLCFNGEPKLMYICSGRGGDYREDFFDMNFNWQPIKAFHSYSDIPPQKPMCFEEMKEIATKLSFGIKHVRIDLYEYEGKVYFGEYTFYDNGGVVRLSPEEWERKLGEWIKL